MIKRCLWVICLAISGVAAAREPVDLDMVNRIRQEAFHHSQVMATLGHLTEDIGPRLTNSPQMAMANAWTRAKFTQWGLANVHDEAFDDFGRGWEFTDASVVMLSPRTLPLHALPEAWTPGTVLAQQFRGSHGVVFANSGPTGGIRQEDVPLGGLHTEFLDGYDGTYRPDADLLFVKAFNAIPNEAFTIRFVNPVASIGSFIGIGAEGDVSTLTIKAFDSSSRLLTTVNVDTALWSDAENREGFWGVHLSDAIISRVSIMNDSQVETADSLILDSLEFSNSPNTGGTPAMAGVDNDLLDILAKDQADN